MSIVIAISGNRCVGKDTAFHHLELLNQNCVRFAFADALKEDLQLLVMKQFNINIFQCKSAAEKEFVRPLLITYGCMWREKDENHWVKKVIQQIQKNNTCIPVIVDVRFENELKLLQETFGDNLVHVNVTNNKAPSPTSEEEKHYRQVAIQAQYEINWGDNTFEEQFNIVESIYNNVQKDYENYYYND